MRSARLPLDRCDGLIWIPVLLEGRSGLRWATQFGLDTGTSDTVLSVQLAELVGYPESERLGRASYDTPDGPVEGYTGRTSRAQRRISSAPISPRVSSEVIFSRPTAVP